MTRVGKILSLVTATAVVAGGIVAASMTPAAASATEWLDPTFGTSGSTVFGSEGYGYEISNADALNRTYVATTELNRGPTHLRRLLANGTVDPAFAGGTGVVVAEPREIIADPGGTVTIFSRSVAGVRIARYTGSGLPDDTFGTNGSLLLPPADPSHVPWFTDAAARSVGGYFIAFRNAYDLGDSIVRGYHYLSVVTSAGVLDPAWAADASTPGYLPLPGGFEPDAIAVDGSSLVFHGTHPLEGGGYQAGMMRLTGEGELDPTFGGDGVVSASVFQHVLLVTASAYYGAGFDGVSKVLRDGNLDLSFGDNGLARAVDLGPNSRAGFFRAHLTANHVVLTAVGGGGMGDLVPLVQRFNFDGELDTSFGDDGLLALPDLATGSYHLGFATTVQSDGRVVGVGGVGNAVVIRIKTTRTPVSLLPGTFVPLSPVRILDTRHAVGVGTTTPVPGQGAVQLQVTGAGGVPATGVSAVVLNVTVTRPTWEGYITAYPTGDPRPTASNLNFASGQTIANLATVQVGAGGRVTLFNGQIRPDETVHIVADVAGYYIAGEATEPGTYSPLVPARILDTRHAVGVGTTTPVPGQGAVQLQVTGAGGVPATGVSAVVLNVTVTRPTWEGYITAYPTGYPRPTASNLNFASGQTIANLVTVQVGIGGTVTIYNGQIAGESLHLVADVAGYYRAGEATASGTFVPLSPRRVLDTRNGTGGYSGAVPAFGEVPLRFDELPGFGFDAVVLNVTVTQPTWDGSVVVFPTGTVAPTASNLNFTPGVTIANLVVAKVGTPGTRTVRLRNGAVQGNLHLVADLVGYFHS